MLYILSSYIDVIASIFIALALVLIFFQIKQINNIMASKAYLSINSTFNSFLLSISQDRTLANLYETGRYDLKPLNSEDKNRFFFLCAQMFGLHENLFLLYESKIIPGHFYGGWKQDLLKNLEQPGFISYWQEQGDEFAPIFQEYVNKYIQNNKLKK